MTNNEIRIYPEWFEDNNDAKRGLDEIRDFLREGKFPVGTLFIEQDQFFIQAEVSEVTNDLMEAAYHFNDGSHPLMFDFVASGHTEGETFHV